MTTYFYAINFTPRTHAFTIQRSDTAVRFYDNVSILDQFCLKKQPETPSQRRENELFLADFSNREGEMPYMKCPIKQARVYDGVSSPTRCGKASLIEMRKGSFFNASIFV